MSIYYKRALLDLKDAPPVVQTLHSYWQENCGSAPFAPKNSIDPVELRAYLGRICVIEIIEHPLDFIYRLDGSNLSSSAREDLQGKSIRETDPAIIGMEIFQDLEYAFGTAAPVLWRIECGYGREKFDYLRLALPYSRSGIKIDHLMTYNHSLLSANGHFQERYGQD